MMTSRATKPSRPLEPLQKALIVGASSGVGAALARLMASHGWRVGVVARREQLLDELCQEINRASGDEPRAFYYVHDVTQFEEVPSLFQQTVRDLGGLDLIVYSAATQLAVSLDEYDFIKDADMIRVNLLGAIAWLNQAAIRFERAGQGHIVGISSIAGDRGRRLNPGYNTSKAGLNTYLEALRNRLSRRGVAVTTIKPGFMDTALLELAPKAFWVISPADAATQIYRAITKRRQTVYIPGRWRFLGLVIRHIPSFIFRRLGL